MRSLLRGRLSSKIGIKLAAGPIAILLMLASLAFYSSVESKTALADSVGLASEAIAESLFDSLSRMIIMRGHEVLMTMENILVVNEVNDSNAAYDAMEDPQEYIDQIDENWTSAPPDVTTEYMDAIIWSNASALLRSQLVEHYVSEHGMNMFGEIFVTNKYGAIVGATGRTSDFRQSDESWWQLAQQGETLITDIEYGESSGIYGSWTCAPIRDDAGEIIGVAKAIINILSLIRDIELTELGYETSQLQITTPDGRLIFSSRAYTMLQDVSSEAFFDHVSGSRGHFSEREGGSDRLFSFVTVIGYHEPEDHLAQIAVHDLHYEGYDWIVFLSHAEDEVLGAANELQVRIFIVAALTMSLSAALSVVLSRSITGPVTELETVTRSMARGELEKRITVTRQDELGRLAKSFNYMASELESLYSDLNKRVKDRTAELDDANKKLGVLFSITRHDAMNQMTVQKGLLWMAIESSKDPVVNDYLRKIEATTDNLVSFFRFTSEYENVGIDKPAWVNVGEAFASATVGLDLKGKELSIKLEGIEVFADPMFPKVLHNLISNSLKHGQTNTAISMSYSEGPDGLTIVMQDNGVGVPVERKETVFQRVITGGRTHGLFLSAEILWITKISIRETGVPGKGARFEILVPEGRYRFVDGPRNEPPSKM